MALTKHKSKLQGSALSRRYAFKGGNHTEAGQPISSSRLLTATQMRKEKQSVVTGERRRRADLSAAQRGAEDARNEINTLSEDSGEDDPLTSVLDGTAQAEVSHAGEGLQPEEESDGDELLEDIRHSNPRGLRRKTWKKRRPEYRTRRNRTQAIVDAFKPQMEAITDAYISWDARSAAEGLGTPVGPPADAMVAKTCPTLVVDLFSARIVDIPMLVGDVFVASGLVNLGYFPCASDEPTVVVTTRVLELFRVTRLRCPRLAIQPFVKSLCDLHGVPFRPYLSAQFSITYDLYLATLAIVDKRVMTLLKRDTPHWRLKNACPCCLYKLEGEPEMLLPVLTTKDGNNSLKRFHKRERNADGTPGASKERRDDRQPPGDVYLTREEVDAWGKDELDELMKDFSSEGFDSETGEEDGGCSERWQNMKEEITSKAWGMYDETGVFLSLCRHGFVLIIADMVRSGELAKYGYAVVNHLIHVLGEVASGYDIGCKFGKMVNTHPILGPLAQAHKFRSLVGAFHGHGHNRRCQLCNLATYVMGVGLEDLEECETFFSKSNSLAASTRYASRFHRQQAIATYLQHTDVFDTYSSLSLLLTNKYKRALEVKSTAPALTEAMRDLGVESKETFEAWLVREKEVLQSLTREPLEETLQMEYYQKLINLEEQTKRMEAALLVPVPLATAGGDYAEEARATRRIESQRRHAIELHNKVLLAVHDLERRLGGAPRWTRDSEEWVATEKLVQRRRYQRTLDQLQGLIIARMFELTKMNMSGTGYKLRKHIAKALQARSRAVKTALTNYNAAASALQPPRNPLTWEQVVEYAFLSDFDLLRDGREDIRSEPWARPAGRLAMDLYFKLLRADEEIVRLNIEIRRFVTYMHDEEAFLLREEGRIRQEHGEAMAYQVRRYRMRQGRFNDDHRYQLCKLARVPGFTGRLDPGVPVNKERLVGAPTGSPTLPLATPPSSDGESDSDSDDDAEDIAVQFALMQVTEDANVEAGARTS